MSETDREFAEIRKRLDLLESRVGFMMRNLGLETVEVKHQNVSSLILNLLAAGDKIGAIKAYRNQTGAGLKDAKNFIESI